MPDEVHAVGEARAEIGIGHCTFCWTDVACSSAWPSVLNDSLHRAGAAMNANVEAGASERTFVDEDLLGVESLDGWQRLGAAPLERLKCR